MRGKWLGKLAKLARIYIQQSKFNVTLSTVFGGHVCFFINCLRVSATSYWTKSVSDNHLGNHHWDIMVHGIMKISHLQLCAFMLHLHLVKWRSKFQFGLAVASHFVRSHSMSLCKKERSCWIGSEVFHACCVIISLMHIMLYRCMWN
ncbi:hypothetical protein F0562_005028 [Nyssa sinensis]|uniref:Uncharacterized protein n=1 Tax=Nyssa sinensis TaxID=561372 RepID=A0A5J5AJL6_9ASTE|nr:hypothetical protein F0562_005028 [Nyssa sinensis]